MLELDQARLRQVIGNLLTNALRFTPSGGSVRVAVAAAADGGVEISVVDTGSGIADDELPHIFDRFYRSADSGGSGLGLPIARSLIEAHGGTIDAESPGQGTTVRINLPPSSRGA
jgi:two-component system sensor histidine kinase BaeS